MRINDTHPASTTWSETFCIFVSSKTLLGPTPPLFRGMSKISFDVQTIDTIVEPVWANALCNYNACFLAKVMQEHLGHLDLHHCDGGGKIVIKAGHPRKTMDVSNVKCPSCRMVVERAIAKIDPRHPSIIVR